MITKITPIIIKKVPKFVKIRYKIKNKIASLTNGYLGTFGKNATKNFKLTLKSDTLLYEPLELIFPYKDTLSTPKTISSSIS